MILQASLALSIYIHAGDLSSGLHAQSPRIEIVNTCIIFLPFYSILYSFLSSVLAPETSCLTSRSNWMFRPSNACLVSIYVMLAGVILHWVDKAIGGPIREVLGRADLEGETEVPGCRS